MIWCGEDIDSGNIPGQRGHGYAGCCCIGRIHQQRPGGYINRGHDVRWERDWQGSDDIRKVVSILNMGGEGFNKGLKLGIDVGKMHSVGEP